ncbi:MAG: DUF5104 domain-containing protein [Clostridia bacterium]|nr:DUF5104 domain-containing protein [Clostridia bacterium]
MKKTWRIMVLLAFIVFSLTACIPFGRTYDSDTEEDVFRTIVQSINQEDKEILQSLFSKKALDDTENMEECIACLFRYIDNKPIKIQGTPASQISTDYENGEKIEKIQSTQEVITETGVKYKLHIVMYSEDTKNPDNVGIYILRVIEGANPSNGFKDTNPDNPGIFVPAQE